MWVDEVYERNTVSLVLKLKIKLNLLMNVTDVSYSSK